MAPDPAVNQTSGFVVRVQVPSALNKASTLTSSLRPRPFSPSSYRQYSPCGVQVQARKGPQRRRTGGGGLLGKVTSSRYCTLPGIKGGRGGGGGGKVTHVAWSLRLLSSLLLSTTVSRIRPVVCHVTSAARGNAAKEEVHGGCKTETRPSALQRILSSHRRPPDSPCCSAC